MATRKLTSRHSLSPIFTPGSRQRPSVAQLYKRELLEAGTLTEDDAASLETEFQLRLEMPLDNVKALEKEKGRPAGEVQRIDGCFSTGIYKLVRYPTAISEETLKKIVDGLTRVPAGFQRSAENKTDRPRPSAQSF